MSHHSSSLQATYERRFGARGEYRQQVWRVLTRDFFQRYIPREGVVLDVGCGWGEFINHITAARKIGMDLNPSTPERLLGGIAFVQQDCSTRWTLEDGSLDAVFTSNFLEHLPTKQALQSTIGEAFRCLKPGGRIICLGPNIKAVHGAYWDFWDHYLPLTELAMQEVLELTGFEVERTVARFLPYTMSSGIAWPMPLIRLYLRMPFAWRFFGGQFLLVARRPAA